MKYFSSPCKFWLSAAFLLLTISSVWLLLSDSTVAAAAEAGATYKLGERLPQKKTAEASNNSFREISWETLIPKNWDPGKDFKNLDMNLLNDGDPRAMTALQALREAWDKAPVEPSLNGARIKIPGFIVPLDGERGKLREFLLVPFFGGCIHTPPPPANQIINVIMEKPASIKMMDAVWVSGVLETIRSDTSMGSAGYRLTGISVTPYVGKK